MANFRISRHPVKALLCLLVLMAGIFPSMSSWGALTVEAPKPGQFRAPFDKRRGIHSYADLVDATVGAIIRVDNWQKVEYKDKKTKKKKSRLVPVSQGSGVFFDAARRLAVTNHHVVEGAEKLTVLLSDGRKASAHLIGADEMTDIAVVQLNESPAQALSFVDSSTVRTGDIVFAAGSPIDLDFSYSMGIVSATKRSLGKGGIEAFIQTDAAINGGNSGGPLLDTAGRIVGINTLEISKKGKRTIDGIGFAVPSDIVVRVIERLIENGRLRRAYHGLEKGASLAKLMADKSVRKILLKELKVSVDSGVFVMEIKPGSPFFNAGIRKGDIITGAGEERIDNLHDIVNFVSMVEADNRYPLVFMRDGAAHRAYLSFSARHELKPKGKTKQYLQFTHHFHAVFTEQPKRFDRRDTCRGVSVAYVDEKKAVGKNRLQVGDIVTAVDSKGINDLQTLDKSLNGRRLEVPVVLCRKDRKMTLSLVP